MSPLSPVIIHRTKDADACPSNNQSRAHLNGCSLSNISPVIHALGAHLREQRSDLMSGQLLSQLEEPLQAKLLAHAKQKRGGGVTK
ncbi:hypothetical protein SAMN06272783_4875 [Serratia sp. JKS296]|nr:hypothetical protein SAMN06272783_4875 [Serratia sp. JKS296]